MHMRGLWWLWEPRTLCVYVCVRERKRVQCQAILQIEEMVVTVLQIIILLQSPLPSFVTYSNENL